MTAIGIKRVGAYVPRLRLDRKAIADAHKWMAPSLKGMAKGARAMASWDEDAVTMAVEAGRSALRDGDAVTSVVFATTRAPYADLQNSALVAGALNLPDNIAAVDAANSMRAGTSALLQALRAGGDTLFVASDAPMGKPASVQEMMYGAGAAAFLLGEGDLIAKLVGSASVTESFVDHFRAAGSKYDYFWEDRWIRDEGYMALAPKAIRAALENAGLAIGDIATMVMPSLLRGAAAAVAKAVKFGGAFIDDIGGDCGFTGAAHAPMLLALALEKAKKGDRIMVVGFGQGADVLIFEATGRIAEAGDSLSRALDDKIVTDSYLRMLSFSDQIDLEWGMRSERPGKTALSEQHRSAFQIESFMAGECPECATIQFPQLEFCVKPGCGCVSSKFKQVTLKDKPAKVLTYTADALSYHPSPPLYCGFVQFENGARIMMEICDVGPGGIDIGTPVRFAFRVKEADKPRGYKRYFWKATPVSA